MHQRLFAAMHPLLREKCLGQLRKILAARPNEELSPYLIELMEWLRDMNWPGAFCILERLRGMVNDPLFLYSYTVCLKYAKALEDEIWERNLRAIGSPAG